MEPHPLRFLRNLGRSREIVTVLLTYGFGGMVERLRLRRYLQWGRRVLLRQKVVEQHLTRAQRIRMALEELGPTFIKFGQVASTRPDLVPADVIEELTRLQESVPPFPGETAVQLVERELEAPVDRLFRSFDMTPLAAGSLAQVHRAVLPDGREVAVKIRRPNAVREIERDLSLMCDLAMLIERHIPEAEIFDPTGLMNQFSRTIRRELNFAREARTIDEFSRMLRNDATMYIPKVEWELTTEAVLTMEFIHGVSIARLDKLADTGVTRHELAVRGARAFMKMAFEFGLFHGDPHPGNLRVLPNGTICLLDFGMIGSLDDEKREQLVDLLLAVHREDVHSAVNVVMELGEPSRAVDAPLLRADVRDFVETYYGLSLERLNVGHMLTDFVTILSNHRIRCPADLMLLIRTFITLEGVGRELDPHFNLAEELAPAVNRVVKDRYNPRRMAQKLTSELQSFLRAAHDAPIHINRTLKKLSRDELKIQLEHRGLDHLITELDRSSNRIVISVAMGSLILASALIMRTDAYWLSLPVFILSSLLGVWLIYGVFRSGRL